MELLLEIVNEFLVPAFFVLITGIIGYVAAYIRSVYKKYVTNQTVKDVVEMSVKYVEQKFTNLKGQQKYEKAIEKIQQLLENKGIEVDYEEIDILIESSVYTFTNQFVELDAIEETNDEV